MSQAYKCDGCDELNSGSPVITAIFGRPMTTDHASFGAGEEVDLCRACAGVGVDAIFREMPTAGDTTYDQEDNGGDREWQVEATKCPNCGQRYPADYTRCENCGTPNQSL